MEVSIVIPTYNHFDDLLRPCVESVLKYTNMNDTEIIVVANGCTDGTKAYLDSLNHPNVRYLWFDKALGYTRAANAGIAASDAKYILLFNNDCVLYEQPVDTWLNMMKAPFANPTCAISGCTKAWCVNARRDFIIFFCALILRDLFEKHGYLDESFSPGGGEDTEFSIRMQDLGYTIHQVVPESEVWSYGINMPIYHAAEATFRHLPDFPAIIDRNSKLLQQRFRKPIQNSVIVVPPDGTTLEDYKRCVHSIWQYTDYSTTEVILVVPDLNGIAEYAHSANAYEQYKIVRCDKTYNEKIAEGVKVAVGKNVVVLNARAVLLPQPKQHWLKVLELNCTAVCGPILKDGVVSLFCFMAKRGLLCGYESIDSECLAVYENKQLSDISPENGMYLGSFPIYFNGPL